VAGCADWLGFGAVAFDLLLAVLVTSLLRTRIGPRTWRAVHWAGYACWPIALVHGLGTGTDGAARWVLARSAGNSTTAGAGSTGGLSGGNGAGTVRSGSSVFPALPFQARLAGTVAFAPGPASGDRIITLAMADGSAVRLKIVISGPPVPGGVTLTASSVTLGPTSAPARYTGHVTVLDGPVLQAIVSGANQRLSLAIDLTSQTSTSVTSTVTARQAGE
jgi:hypothetical protein